MISYRLIDYIAASRRTLCCFGAATPRWTRSAGR
jgi:hypothetical protein